MTNKEKEKMDLAVEAEETPTVKAGDGMQEVKLGAHMDAAEARAERHDAADLAVEAQLPAPLAAGTDERDEAAENLIRWGTARAGVIVLTPLLGGIALMANEVYMISRLAKVYDVKLSDRAIMSFLGALGARAVGHMAVAMIPLPGLSLPVAVSVTYGIGKVAQSWIKDGLPLDVKPYVEKFSDLKEQGEEKVEELMEHEQKNEPLGDETYAFGGKNCPLREKAGTLADGAEKVLTDVLLMFGVKQETIDDKKALARGVYEVTKETTAELAADWKERAGEARKEAKERAADLKEQAKERAAELKEDWKERAAELKEDARDKAEELKDRVEERAAEAKERAAELKEDAQDKAAELKDRVEEKAAEAKERAAELKEEAQDKAAELKEKVEEKAAEVKEKAEEKKAK